jgi:hypothetical protein
MFMTDPTVTGLMMAPIAGPEVPPAESFDEAVLDKILTAA